MACRWNIYGPRDALEIPRRVCARRNVSVFAYERAAPQMARAPGPILRRGDRGRDVRAGRRVESRARVDVVRVSGRPRGGAGWRAHRYAAREPRGAGGICAAVDLGAAGGRAVEGRSLR